MLLSFIAISLLIGCTDVDMLRPKYRFTTLKYSKEVYVNVISNRNIPYPSHQILLLGSLYFSKKDILVKSHVYVNVHRCRLHVQDAQLPLPPCKLHYEVFPSFFVVPNPLIFFKICYYFTVLIG